MTERELESILALGKETRRIEFKRSEPWNVNQMRGKITKTILGMSNIRDGGVIVIGVQGNVDGSYSQVGVQAAHLGTYDPDQIGRHVLNFADPSAVFSVSRLTFGGNTFVVFEVQEFAEIPIVCRADGPEGLERGKIYTRNDVPETVAVPGETEMREILTMAIDKGMRAYVARLVAAGILQPAAATQNPDDRRRFEEELRDLDQ